MYSDSEKASAPQQRLTPAVRMGLSISVATGLYGISFGALAVAAGLQVWQAMALSALMFTGGSQFAFIGVIAGGGTGAAALGAASLLGVRNAVYGMQMNRMLGLRGWRRWLGAQLTIDESAATASGQLDAAEQRRGFWTAGLGVYLLWNAFTLLGAWLGDALGDPRQWGLDGAAVAAFLGLLWPRLQQREPVALAVLCGVVTALAVPVLPPGLPILVAAVVGAAWGWWRSGSQAGGCMNAIPLDMGLWGWILGACAVAFATKLAGYAVPARWLQNPRMTQVAACMTVALLAALTVMNTFAAGTSLVLDARLAALAVAAVALWLRAPFLLVVVLGAVAAAVVRWLV